MLYPATSTMANAVLEARQGESMYDGEETPVAEDAPEEEKIEVSQEEAAQIAEEISQPVQEG